MARTYKDRFYCAYCEHSYEEQIGWGVGCSGVKNYLKKYTNRKMRHHKGFIKSITSKHPSAPKSAVDQ